MDVLKQLYARLGVFTLHNHQVTGDRSIFDRDRAIAEWCRILGVEWREYAQNGVCRPVSKRGKRFRDHWNTWGEAPLIRIPEHRNWAGPNKLCAVSSMPETIKSDAYPCLGRQTGGSPQAQYASGDPRSMRPSRGHSLLARSAAAPLGIWSHGT